MSKQKKYLAQKFGAVDSLARIIPLRGKEEGLGVRGVASFGRGSGSSGKYAPNGYSSKMFPDFTLLGKDWISGLFSVGWAMSGMVYRGEVWMLSFSDSPKDAGACLLSDVLEDRVHQKYFLSAEAARGILRRSEKRGVKLPQALKDALITTVDSERQSQHSWQDRERKQEASPIERSKVQRSKRQTAEQTERLASSGRSSADTMGAPEEAVETPLLPMPSHKESAKAATPPKTNSLSAKMFSRPRRLTPTECERLQGFPDGWTLLEHLQPQNVKGRLKKEKGKTVRGGIE